MFNSVSWSQYFLTLLVATALYYLFIWITVFKARIPVLASIKRLPGLSMQAEDSPDEMLTTAQHVMDELRPLIGRDTSQNEILYSLQQRLRKYHMWEEAGFRETINRFILDQFQTTCSIRLSEDEISALWK